MPKILPGLPRSGHNGGMRPWLLLAGAAYAAIGATFTSHSIPALIAVLVPGLAVLVAVAVLRRPRPEPTGVTTGRRAWVVWAVCFTAWELAALLLGELSFSLLMDPVLEIYPMRIAGWALWLSAGWLLVRR
jgi:hypothetical protein